MLGIIFIVVISLCALMFPAFLIEAIKEENEETAKIAKKFACGTFGVLFLAFTIFELLLHL